METKQQTETEANPRQQRGLQIAKTCQITKTEQGNWKVPSQSGAGYYTVESNGFGAKCTCPDHETRRCKCKHIFAVEYIVTGEVNAAGQITITQTVRKTYAQNWPAYDNATTHQKELFMKFLKDATATIPQPAYEFGRPTLPVSDMIYGAVMKVFTTFSLRRFMGDMKEAKEKGYVKVSPCYSSIGHFMQREDLTPIFAGLVTVTSLPLRSVEKDFTIDSTGFGTGVFQRWFSFKYGKEISSKRWVKCHFLAGVKTHTITSVKITSEFDSDCPELAELAKKTAENFDMDELSGDKAYLSRANLELIAGLGAAPFIPFRSNSQGSGNGAVWKKMYHFFMLQNGEFLEHYHKRSNAESTVHMVKSKFGDTVRSKTWTAQVNEVLCKIICHNICVVIQEMNELGIEADFCVKSAPAV